MRLAFRLTATLALLSSRAGDLTSARMTRQLSLLPAMKCEPARVEHGGEIRLGRRKLARPISSRRPLHLVMRSSRAQGRWSMRTKTNDQVVRTGLRRYARRYGIKVYEFANVGNHLHLLVRTKCRLGLQNFLRVFAGVTARRVTGARPGHRIGKFWEYLAYSRVMTWGRDFLGVRAYVAANEAECEGSIPPRVHAAVRRRAFNPRE